MPSGKTHDKIAVLSIIPLYFGCLYFANFSTMQSAIFSGVAFFSQMMFGPDLDTKSSQYNRWGFLKWIWIPYKKFVSHRSSLSHGLILGPVFRCLYLMFFLYLIFYIVRYLGIMLLEVDFVNFLEPVFYGVKAISEKYIHENELLAAIAGLFSGAAIHTLSDKVGSFFKNLF